MSEIKKLIERLCPDGVEYKKLGEIGTFTRGNGLQKKDFLESGFPCIHYGQIYTRFGLFTDKTLSFCSFDLASKLVKAKTGDMIIACTSENVEDVCKPVVWLGEGEVATGGHACVFSHNQEPKYVAYFFRSEKFFEQKKRYAKGVKVIDIKIGDLEKIEIPVPPIEVQKKIVEILDNFTELEAELEAKLEAELEARRKQYEYYRNQLLTFDEAEGARFEKLGNLIISLKTGLNPRKNFLLNEVGSNKPYITGKDIFANRINVTDKTDMINDIAVKLINKRACLESGLLLFASTGTGTVGRMAIIEKYNNDWAMSETLYAIKTKDELSSKFLMHFLYSDNAKKQFEPKISKGSVPHLKVVDLLNVVIPIPSLSEQQRIVSILDRFEALTTDLQSGLPAEIEARRKQYEYYREQLLTFKRKTA